MCAVGLNISVRLSNSPHGTLSGNACRCHGQRLPPHNGILSLHTAKSSRHNETRSRHNETRSPYNESISPHNESISRHNETISPHNESISPHNENISPHNGNISPHEENVRQCGDGKQLRYAIAPGCRHAAKARCCILLMDATDRAHGASSMSRRTICPHGSPHRRIALD